MADSFGQRLQQARKRVGLTQIELARKLDVTQGTISRWQRNVVLPSNPDIVRIAAAVEDPDLVRGLPDFDALVTPPPDAESRGKIHAELRDLRLRYDHLRSEMHRYIKELHTLLAHHESSRAGLSAKSTKPSARPKLKR